MDLSSNSRKNEVLPVKIEARVLELWLDMSSSLNCPNVVSKPQAPMSIGFWRLHNFIGLISWFWKKEGSICENWSYVSRLMAGYVFWAQVAKPQTPRLKFLFWDFIIFLNFSHDFGENEVLFVKTGTRVLD